MFFLNSKNACVQSTPSNVFRSLRNSLWSGSKFSTDQSIHQSMHLLMFLQMEPVMQLKLVSTIKDSVELAL